MPEQPEQDYGRVLVAKRIAERVMRNAGLRPLALPVASRTETAVYPDEDIDEMYRGEQPALPIKRQLPIKSVLIYSMSRIRMQLESGNEYSPDVVTAPGATLQEVLEDRGMSQTELADRLGLSHKTVNEIIRGKAALTHETALALETVLGIPAGFWNTYETAYRESLARRAGDRKLEEYAEWLDTMPWQSAVKMGWIRRRGSISEQTMEVLRYFGVVSPKQYEEVYGELAVLWRRSPSHVANRDAAAFWLRQGELDAEKLSEIPGVAWNEFDARRFEEILKNARALTLEREPVSFVEKLQALCAAAGVAVVFVPELKGTCAGGATRWLTPSKALIQLSLRYKTNDQLWFHFFHEAAHILKHSKKQLFLEPVPEGGDSDAEREADLFAQNTLIPPRDYEAFARIENPTKADVESFAGRIGVDPGIVVERLQRDKRIGQNCYNDLKQRYVWY